MTIHFTLQPPEVTKQLRKQFDRRKLNQVFVRWLYRKGLLDKYADMINLDRAAKGRVPHGFDVHHIIPLSGGGQNRFSNFCLIERSLHKFINKKCFESVYLGVRITEEDKKNIIDVARKLNPDIKIYQMKTDPEHFKLDLELCK